jgi:hypothetical protein
LREGTFLRKVHLSDVAAAYDASRGESRKALDSLFRNEYLDFESLKDAATKDNVSLCPIGAGRVAYAAIEAYIREAEELRK